MEFIKEYWQFFAAGLILIALIAYWIFDVVRAKKAKEKQLEEMEAKLKEEEVVKEPVEEVKAEEKKEEKQENDYMISYDKEKKDWVVKKRGSKRATKRTKTKKEAQELVKSLTEKKD